MWLAINKKLTFREHVENICKSSLYKHLRFKNVERITYSETIRITFKCICGQMIKNRIPKHLIKSCVQRIP